MNEERTFPAILSRTSGRSLRRQVATIAVLLLCPLLTYAAFVMSRAYRAAPRFVASAERSGRLALRLDDFPAGFLEALVTVEDPRFYRHPGIDPITPGAGFTTITQSVVKQLYFDGVRSRFLGTLKEGLIALSFDARVSKREQLRVFVSMVYLGAPAGRPLHGFHEGARGYFGKDLKALTRPEFLALVAAIVDPNELDPARHDGENAARVRRIEKLLRGECRPIASWDIYYRGCGS